LLAVRRLVCGVPRRRCASYTYIHMSESEFESESEFDESGSTFIIIIVLPDVTLVSLVSLVEEECCLELFLNLTASRFVLSLTSM